MMRGEDIFLADSDIQRQASAEFFILILQCIQDWAQMFKIDRHKNDSLFVKTYQELKDMGVIFPEFIPFESPSGSIGSNIVQDIKNCKVLLNSVNQLVSEENPDKNFIKQQIKLLIGNRTEFEKELKRCAEKDQMTLVSELTQMIDDINKAYQIYRYLKKSSVADRTAKKVALSASFKIPVTIKSYVETHPKSAPRPGTPEIFDGKVVNTENLQKSMKSENECSPVKYDKFDLEIEQDSEWKELKDDYINLKDKYAESIVLINRYKAEFDHINEEYTNMKIKVDDLEDKLSEETDKSKSLSEKASNLTKELHLHKSLQEENKAIIINLQSANNSLEERLSEMEKSLKCKEEDLAKRAILAQDLSLRIEKSNSEIETLKKKEKDNLIELEKRTIKNNSLNMQTILSYSANFKEKNLQSMLPLPSETLIPASEIQPSQNSVEINSLSDKVKIIRNSAANRLSFSSNTSNGEENFAIIEDLSPRIQRDSIDSPGIISFHSPQKDANISIDNEYLYTCSLLNKTGLIYQDNSVQVYYLLEVDQNNGKTQFAIKNLTQQEIKTVQFEVIQATGINVSLQMAKNILRANSSIEIIMQFCLINPFPSSPIAKLTYGSETKYVKLPITYVLFFKPSLIQDPQSTWQSLSSCKLQKKFLGLHPHIRSMKTLVETCGLHGKLRAAFVDGQRSVVIYGQAECPVMCKISLNKSASSGRIEVRCQDDAVREIMASLIKGQVSPDQNI